MFKINRRLKNLIKEFAERMNKKTARTLIKELVKQCKFKCKRCGRCCEDLGTIFVNTDHPLIQAIIEPYFKQGGRYLKDTGGCPVLAHDKGQAVCLIEKYLGRDAKPKVCQEYEGEGHCRKQ